MFKFGTETLRFPRLSHGSGEGRGCKPSGEDTVEWGVMRRAEFDRLMHGEFGDAKASWILDSHIVGQSGSSAFDLIEQGVDLRDVWEALCEDFDVPEERRLGEDL